MIPQPRSTTNVDLQNKVLLVKDYLISDLNAPIEKRLFRAIGGIGCLSIDKRQMVSTVNIVTGEPMAWMRSNFEGWYTEQEIEDILHHDQLVE